MGTYLDQCSHVAMAKVVLSYLPFFGLVRRSESLSADPGCIMVFLQQILIFAIPLCKAYNWTQNE